MSTTLASERLIERGALRFLRIEDEDRKWLIRIGERILPFIPGIIDQFYNHLIRFDEINHLLNRGDTLQRLKKMQLNYFRELFASDFNENYFVQRKMIGKTHRRMGVDPMWYIGGYSLFCELMFPYLRHAFGSDPAALEKAQNALLKAFFLDIQIAVGAYIERYAQQLIEARQELEQKLWIEDHILYSIMKKSGDAIIGLDGHDRIVTWSQGAQRIFGYKTIEIVDKKPSDLLVDPEEFEHLKTAAENQGPQTLHGSHWRHKDGSTLMADATLTCLRGQDGCHAGATLIVRDQTEIHRLAAEVKNMEKLSAMTKITAGVAHEIRTPLGVLSLTTDMMRDRLNQAERTNEEPGEIYPELTDMVKDVQTEVGRLNEIVNHYLVLSRIKSPSKTQIHLDSYISTLRTDLEAMTRGKSIQLTVDRIDPQLFVTIDPDHFRHVFLNLVDNAAHAIEKSGAIHIAARRRDGDVTISIGDTGVGIPRERLDSLFSPFVTNKPGGTGLGLYLVKEIVDAHLGRVSIESEPGHGATVFISLPIADRDYE